MYCTCYYLCINQPPSFAPFCIQNLMSSIGLFEASSIVFFFFLIFYYFLIKKPFHYFLIKKTSQSYPWNWPVLGMLPGVLVRLNRIYDGVKILENYNMTFPLKGPWFAGMDVLVTVDPSNVHHIMSKNFSNYIKGPEFQEVFEIFGNGLLNSESDRTNNLWKCYHAMLHDQRFQRFSICAIRNKLKDELLPLLDHFAKKGTVVDLQDVFRRFTFDTAVTILGVPDPRSLSVHMANNEFVKALEDVEVAMVYRHMLPRFVWKLQNRLGLGQEKMLIEADAVFRRLCGKYVSDKRDEIRNEVNNEEVVDLLTFFIKFDLLAPIDDKLLRDVFVGFILAARDTIASTLTWFFWLLAKNPQAVTKIYDEIHENLPRSGSGHERPSYDDPAELDKLVYLHGALCESMRLYPPVPFQRRSAIKQDVLPSGHKVDANSRIMIFAYAMGMMRAVWGEDALEFKPERWVTATGGIRHEPAYKFFAFNAGPRACLGKNMAMTQLKTVVVGILQNYDVEVIKGQKIEPFSGLILHMKHGLRVRFNKRC
uniref:Alkane hydroxylase MAH1 n=1 Tax=Noccaea caerulescens TaxID=107243 RepID=A0A1J3FD89_NOCCA